MEKYLIVDGSAVIHRAFHALPPFTSLSGIPTNALHGFIKMILSLVERIRPNYMSICYDTPKPTFRKKLMPAYQAQRPHAPEEFKVQIPLTMEFLDRAKIKYYLKEGYEADDIISTIVKKAKHSSKLCFYILTGDKDILQLVDKAVTVIMPNKGVSNVSYMDEEAVFARLGIKPQQIVDYKALVGDPSDNYPGVQGIGPKSAVKLLREYETVTNLYQHLDQLEPKLADKLKKSKDNALLSETLARLVSDVDFPYQLTENQFKSVSLNEELRDFCDKYGLKSIKNQLFSLYRREKPTAVDKEEDNQLSFF